MEFNKAHALYQGPAHVEFLSGWGYDLEIKAGVAADNGRADKTINGSLQVK